MSFKNNIILVGYSGHGLVLAEMAILNNYQILGYTESSEKSVNPFYLNYLGTQSEYFSNNEQPHLNAIIAVGDNKIRNKVVEEVSGEMIHFPTLIHPNASISTYSELKEGTVVMRMASVNPNAIIGRFCIVNTSSVIEHDVVVGDFVHIAAGASILGGAKIGTGVYIGSNAVIRQSVVLGDNCMIMPGSVVSENVPSGETWLGNPAKRIA